jgi:VanZ family protein
MTKWLTAAFALVLLTIVTSATMGWAEPVFAFVRQVPYSDKVAHFVLLGTMSLLLNLMLNVARVQLGSFALLKGSAILLVLVTIEEFSQIWISTRTFSWLDLVCNYLGIVVFGWLAVRLSANRQVIKNETG